jgi:hypothetical protein
MSFNRFSPEPSLLPRLPDFALNPQPVSTQPVVSLFDLSPFFPGLPLGDLDGRVTAKALIGKQWDFPFKAFPQNSESDSVFCRKAFRKPITKYSFPPKLMSLFNVHKTSSTKNQNLKINRKCKSAISKTIPTSCQSPVRRFNPMSRNFQGSPPSKHSPAHCIPTPWANIQEARILFERQLENSPLRDLSVTCQPASMSKFGPYLAFRCSSESEKDRRTVDIILDKRLVKIAKKMHRLEFEYIQKSVVHILTGPKIVVVNYIEGYSLSEFIGDHTALLEECFIRSLLRDILRAILYLFRKTGCDFGFSEHDVIVISKRNKPSTSRFKLANVILQNLSFSFQAKRFTSSTFPTRFQPRDRSDLCGVGYPETAMRCLGELAIGLCNNGNNFKEPQANFKCPWLSESLNAILRQLLSLSGGLSVESILRRLDARSEISLERNQQSKLSERCPCQVFRDRRPRCNSNHL